MSAAVCCEKDIGKGIVKGHHQNPDWKMGNGEQRMLWRNDSKNAWDNAPENALGNAWGNALRVLQQSFLQ